MPTTPLTQQEFRRENGLRSPASAVPAAQHQQPAIGPAGSTPGPQAHGWPGLRSA